MKRWIVFSGMLLAACSVNRPAMKATDDTGPQSIIDSISRQFAPDKRTVLFNMQWEHGVIKGETTSPSAKTALLQAFGSALLPVTDSIEVLPSPELSGKIHGVVALSVANLRTQPSHRAELATQATMGTPVRIFKREKGWYLVQTPDEYLAWVDFEGIRAMDSTAFSGWKQAEKIIFTEPFGFAYADGDQQAPVSDLVYGNIVQLLGNDGEYLKVLLPDGRKAQVLARHTMQLAAWQRSRSPEGNNMVQSARMLMGLPYLWGGTSFKGVDCSGFTKTVYFMNGLVLPRDASQQVRIGVDVNTEGSWSALQPGDLLFFGAPARNGNPERVVHVGIWIGNGEFIHASGKVQVASLDPAAANYDAMEHKRFLKAKRILPHHSLLDLRTAKLF